MKQRYEHYSEADQKVWKLLFRRQLNNLADKACGEYLDALRTLEPVLNAQSIPHFSQIDTALTNHTGWSIEVVPGHIPVNEFFELLSHRRFPSSTWLRTIEQLDYLEEPDMFHDIFGHIPLLVDHRYAEFMVRIGELGVKWSSHHDIVQALRSLYWFTIEFGMLSESGRRRIYGAGILSSFGESQRVMMANTECHPFDLGEILGTDFRTDAMQEKYYGAPSYGKFLDSIDEVEHFLAHKLEKVRPGH